VTCPLGIATRILSQPRRSIYKFGTVRYPPNFQAIASAIAGICVYVKSENGSWEIVYLRSNTSLTVLIKVDMGNGLFNTALTPKFAAMRR